MLRVWCVLTEKGPATEQSTMNVPSRKQKKKTEVQLLCLN